MEYTENYALLKPEGMDECSNEPLNMNADEIDRVMHEIQDHLDLHDEELDNKLGKTATAAAAVLDGVGGNIAEQFEQNNSDILAAKNDIAVNLHTLGTQCKNLFNKDGDINYIYTGGRPTHQKLYSTVSGNVITVRAPLTLTNIAGQFISKAKGKKIILSGKLLSINSSNSADMLAIRAYTRNVPAPIFDTRTNNIGEFSCKIDCEEYDEVFVCFGLWYGDGTAEIENIMVRYADVTDGTYEPYVPSLQEQINTLVAEIAELKAQTTTVSEAE